jgi:hypothetical protein
MALGNMRMWLPREQRARKCGEDFYVLEKMARASALSDRSVQQILFFEEAINVAEGRQGEIPDYVISDL